MFRAGFGPWLLRFNLLCHLAFRSLWHYQLGPFCTYFALFAYSVCLAQLRVEASRYGLWYACAIWLAHSALHRGYSIWYYGPLSTTALTSSTLCMWFILSLFALFSVCFSTHWPWVTTSCCADSLRVLHTHGGSQHFATFFASFCTRCDLWV